MSKKDYILVKILRLSLAWTLGSCAHSSPPPSAEIDSCLDVRQAQASSETESLSVNVIGQTMRAGSSYLVTGASYAGEGLVTFTSWTLAFIAQCGVPLALIANSHSGVFWSDWQATCFGDEIYHYDPKWGKKTWETTESWRRVSEAPEEHADRLELAACYAAKGSPDELRENIENLQSMRLQKSWADARAAEMQRLGELERASRERLISLEPGRLVEEQKSFERLTSRLNHGDFETFQQLETGSEWVIAQEAVSAEYYEKACGQIPRPAGQSSFHLATASQLSRARTDPQLRDALSRLASPAWVRVKDRNGREVGFPIKKGEENVPRLFFLLCVRS